MPLAGWICSLGCGGREVPVDHFQRTRCGEKVHPDYAAAIAATLASSAAERKGLGVTVSQGLGCPRAGAIEKSEPVHVDPLDYNARETGTAWHAWVERTSVDRANTEIRLHGVIDGIKISGKADRLRPPDPSAGEPGTVEDWKHKNEFALKYTDPGRPNPEHRVQTSILGELVAQAKGWRPAQGANWYHFSGGGAKAMIAVRYPLLSVEEALAHRPYGGLYTVRELYEMAGQFAAGAPWRRLPLAGESQRFGDKTACHYCSVRAVCKLADGKAPF